MKKGILASMLIAALALAGCTQSDQGDAATASNTTQDNGAQDSGTESGDTRVVTDNMDREVEVPAEVDEIVALGSMGPRFAAYMGLVDNLVGAEEIDQKGAKVNFDYTNVYHQDLMELPIVGRGGGSGENNAYAEEIIQLQPDVILAGFDTEAADELQRQTGIPVVSVRYRAQGFIDDEFGETLELIGEITGTEDRAEEINTYIADIKQDLQDRVADVEPEDKQKVYTGAVTFNGAHGFNYTYVDFPAFDAIEAHNVADELKETHEFTNRANGIEVDWEQVTTWDPDVIFLDPGNMDLVNEEYATRPDYFHSLRAVQNDDVYTMPATNAAGPNVTYLLINAYHAGKVLYPEEFADVDFEEKAGEIMELMLGEDFLAEMEEGGLTYGKITIGQ